MSPNATVAPSIFAPWWATLYYVVFTQSAFPSQDGFRNSNRRRGFQICKLFSQDQDSRPSRPYSLRNPCHIVVICACNMQWMRKALLGVVRINLDRSQGPAAPLTFYDRDWFSFSLRGLQRGNVCMHIVRLKPDMHLCVYPCLYLDSYTCRNETRHSSPKLVRSITNCIRACRVCAVVWPAFHFRHFLYELFLLWIKVTQPIISVYK